MSWRVNPFLSAHSPARHSRSRSTPAHPHTDVHPHPSANGKATSSWRRDSQSQDLQPKVPKQGWSTILPLRAPNLLSGQPVLPVAHDRWRWLCPSRHDNPKPPHRSRSAATESRPDTAGGQSYLSRNDRPCWSASPCKPQPPTAARSPDKSLSRYKNRMHPHTSSPPSHRAYTSWESGRTSVPHPSRKDAHRHPARKQNAHRQSFRPPHTAVHAHALQSDARAQCASRR